LSDPIYVTQPFLPPLSEFVSLLETIWSSKILTNQGPFHQQFEARLRGYLGVEHISLTANGMLALEAALGALPLSGEVVTTPYSFVATTHAIRRSGLEPVFADVSPVDLNIDPIAVERAITPRTCAIVAVHCYGNPCDVDALEALAKRHGLALIYDAAHAFGVRHKGRSLPSFGDLSALSFHATKVFNTFEGGAVIAGSADNKAAIDRLKNFGITSETTISSVGFNAKMSEINAAFGLLQLEHFETCIQLRRRVDRHYREALSGVKGLRLIAHAADTEPNYSYFPLLVEEDFRCSRDELYEELKQVGIYARRYFYPLLSNIPSYQDLPSARQDELPVANAAVERILCLPIYPSLSTHDQDRIIEGVIGRGPG